MSSEEREESDNVKLLGSVFTVACRGFAVGAGLHLGQQVISGVATGKLLSQ